MTEIKSNNNRNRIYKLVTYALIATLLCIFGPLSVPIGPIPISLTNLCLYFAIFIIGKYGTTVSYLVYMLLGIFGLPVFSGYMGGLAKVAGPTGGYLVGFIPMILIMGFAFELSKSQTSKASVTVTVLGMIIGTAVAYVLGTAWFVFQMSCSWGYALTVCVVPFIPFDIIKMIIANILGRRIRKPLIQQGFIRG